MVEEEHRGGPSGGPSAEADHSKETSSPAGESQQVKAQESKQTQVTKPSATEKPATEKPVPTETKSSEYVVSVDNATGLCTKIEKLDAKTGQRTELTPAEYAGAYAYANYAGYLAPHSAAHAAMYDPLSSPATEAYLRGIADYVKAITAKR